MILLFLPGFDQKKIYTILNTVMLSDWLGNAAYDKKI